MKVIPFNLFIEMPWKNGQGISYEIFKHIINPCNDNKWDLRLSMAKITGKSSFSTFIKCERFLTIVRGNGIYFNGQKLERGVVIKFSGEDTVESEPLSSNEEIMDFGIIFNPELYEVEMKFGKLNHYMCTSEKAFICFLNTLEIIELDKDEKIHFSNQDVVWVSMNCI
jgi:environmental stress-induced protein Ves